MSKLAKALTAAAGNAGESLYVEDVFSTYLYEGNSSTQTITNGIDLDGEGGLVWLKTRSSTTTHALFDTERGVSNKLSSDTTGAATTSFTGVSAFNSDGFSLGSIYNTSPVTYASWTFRKAEKFFDVVTFSTSGAGGTQSVNHNLGVTPAFIIIKKTSAAQTWLVYHSSVTSPNSDWWKNFTALDDGVQFFDWGDNSGIASAPTDSSVTLGSYFTGPTADYVMYLFASDAGGFGDDDESIIKCGSFSGDSNADIALGFEPQFLIYKRTDTTGSWGIFDVMRGMTVDGNGTYLLANTSGAEATVSEQPSPIANGFRWNSTAVGSNYIYIAIRRPMKTPESGTEVFSPVTYSGNGLTRTISAGFPIDSHLNFVRNATIGNPFASRLQGGNLLETQSTAAEAVGYVGYLGFDNMSGLELKTGVQYGFYNSTSNTYVSYMFKRATGFFDVVAYTGNGSASGQVINHNLGVTPEIIIIKGRSNSGREWHTYVSSQGQDKALFINSSGAEQANTALVGGTINPTQYELKVDFGNVNGNGETYISYLFATLAGVSKVGSYTGTGADLNVDCGFSAGARFILIKRTDSTGDWYVYDSERGIVAGNDPYLLLNSTAAEVTNTDYIDPLSSGFTVTSSAPAALNASGGTYIFLAIA